MADIRVYTAANRATVYRLTVVDDDGEDWFLLFSSRWEEHNGDWLKIPAYLGEGGPSLSWDYLTEKCPGLARFAGDVEGWIKVCGQAGIEVFR